MDIVLIYDDNYKEYAEITKASILEHNPDANIHTINKVPDKVIKEFIEYENKLHPTSICYGKLFIHELLPKLDKVLYLDVDLIVLDSLKELYNTSFDGNYIVGCESHNYGKIQAKELGIDKYFNSGVMLLDLKAMRENNVSEYIRKHFKSLVGKTLWVYDETIINGLLSDKIKFISQEWNYCINRAYDNKIKEPKILHFIGGDKKGMLKWQKQ